VPGPGFFQIRLMGERRARHWALHEAGIDLAHAGRRASFATTDRTWWCVTALKEQTIITFSYTNESGVKTGGGQRTHHKRRLLPPQPHSR